MSDVVAPAEDTKLMEALVDFTECIGAAFPSVCSYSLTVGDSYVPFRPDPDSDECDDSDEEGDCSQLWVRMAQVAPAANSQEGWSGNCALELEVQLEVGILRCYEIEDGGEAPTTTDALASALQAAEDMQMILCAALGCEVWDRIDAENWMPLGPLGGQYGGTWSFTVII